MVQLPFETEGLEPPWRMTGESLHGMCLGDGNSNKRTCSRIMELASVAASFCFHFYSIWVPSLLYKVTHIERDEVSHMPILSGNTFIRQTQKSLQTVKSKIQINLQTLSKTVKSGLNCTQGILSR